MMVGSGEERINKPTAGCDASDYYSAASLLLLLLLAPRLTCVVLQHQMNDSSTGWIHYHARDQDLSSASKLVAPREGHRQPNAT